MNSRALVAELPRRAERNKLDKRRRIMRAARELFRRKGYTATTTSEIAERADVGKGTLFLYARSKQELLVMFFQEIVGESVDRGLATVPDGSLIDQIMHVFEVMIDYNLRDVELSRVFVKEIQFIEGDRTGIAAVMSRLFAGLERLIDAAQARGEIGRQVDASALAHNLFALFFVFLLNWLGKRGSAPDFDHLRRILALQLDHLRPVEREISSVKRVHAPNRRVEFRNRRKSK